MKDAVIISALRTAVGSHGGALAGVRPDDLAAIPIKAVVERTGVDPSRIDDVLLGCANQSGEDNRNVARMAALLADLPVEVPAQTINRLCGSGFQSVNVNIDESGRCHRPPGTDELLGNHRIDGLVEFDTLHSQRRRRLRAAVGAIGMKI